MIETLTCPNCGQSIETKKTHGLEDSKSVTCSACKLKSSLGQWRLNANHAIKDIPSQAAIRPPTPSSLSIDRTVGHVEVARSEERTFDLYLVLGLWIAGSGLLLTCLSPFFKWVSIGAGGVTGLAGDGKILLAISVIAVGAFVLAIVKRAWLTPLLVPVQAWGTIVAFWMGTLLWKLSSLTGETAVEENIFAAMFSKMLVSPGVGLYVGLIGGIFTAGALCYVTGRQLFERNRRAVFFVTQIIALCIGALLAVLVAPSEVPKSDGKNQSELFRFGPPETSDENMVEAVLGKPFNLGSLQITPVGFESVALRERRLFGDSTPREKKSYVFTFSAKNISDGLVFSPYTAMKVSDNYGNDCPDPTDSSAFSTSVRIDANEMFDELRPGKSAHVKVAFDPQLDTAKEYTCVLTTKTSNENNFENCRIKFVPQSAKPN